MTILAAILCRAFGHKPYEHPGIAWNPFIGHQFESHMVMIKRCRRCHVKLGQRPMLCDDGSIEA